MIKLKYKVGDKVRIKSLDWYNKNINNKGVIVCGSESFTHPMSHFCNEVVNIITIQDNCYRIFEDGGDWYWTDEMIEGLVEEETKPKMVNLEKACEWLKENIWVYINYEGCSGEELENDVIEDFRKAMEE